MTFELRPLRRDDDRSGFNCGMDPLNTFFRRYAHHHQFKHGISVTWVAVEAERVAGFVTVTATTVSREAIPEDFGTAQMYLAYELLEGEE